jgi:hypothetical protein
MITKPAYNAPDPIGRRAASGFQAAALVFRTPLNLVTFSVAVEWNSPFYWTKS